MVPIRDRRNGNDLVGATVSANGQYFDMTVGIRIDRMEDLKEGDVVDVEFTTSGHYSTWYFGGVAAPSIAGSYGSILFTARNSGTHLYLTRTGEPSVGRLEASVASTPHSGAKTGNTIRPFGRSWTPVRRSRSPTGRSLYARARRTWTSREGSGRRM